MRSRRRVPDSQLQKLVDRLLQCNKPEVDIPVIISSADEDHSSAAGRLLEHKGARVSAIVDVALAKERPVAIFLPSNAYIGEVVSCVAQGEQFVVELMLIQHRSDAS
jgi:hypothetical protein